MATELPPDFDITKYRKSTGLTQSDVASRMGITTSAVSAYERNFRVPPERWVSWCRAVGIDSDTPYNGSLVKPGDKADMLSGSELRVLDISMLPPDHKVFKSGACSPPDMTAVLSSLPDSIAWVENIDRIMEAYLAAMAMRCRKLGIKWRHPTRAKFEDMIKRVQAAVEGRTQIVLVPYEELVGPRDADYVANKGEVEVPLEVRDVVDAAEAPSEEPEASVEDFV